MRRRCERGSAHETALLTACYTRTHWSNCRDSSEASSQRVLAAYKALISGQLKVKATRSLLRHRVTRKGGSFGQREHQNLVVADTGISISLKDELPSDRAINEDER